MVSVLWLQAKNEAAQLKIRIEIKSEKEDSGISIVIEQKKTMKVGVQDYVTFSDASDYKPGAEKPQNQQDMMKNLPKAMGNLSKAMGGGGPLTESPTFKISMREYEDMAIKVGDKITVEIKKSDSSSGRQIKNPRITILLSNILCLSRKTD